MTVQAAEGLAESALGWLLGQVGSKLGNPGLLTVSTTNGLSVDLNVPDGGPVISLDGLQFGPDGFSGTLGIEIDATPLQLTLFGGFAVALTDFQITLTDSAVTGTNIAGALTIPYFTDNGQPKTIDIEVTVGSGGALTVTLAAQQSDPGSTTPDGLVDLQYQLPGDSSIDLQVATLEVSDASGSWTLTLTGQLTLATVGINWPEIDVRGLSIDAAGHVQLQGGWLDLPAHTAISFFGFHVALEQVGFGSDATGRWIGFSGEVNLVDGVPLGGSVRGLQVNLDTGAVSFSGVSVDFAIPDVLTFSGEIEHAHLNTAADAAAAGLPSSFPTPADVFAGGVDVTIEAAGDLEIDAQFIVAQVAGVGSCFFLAMDAELPAGIPIFSDVALYGLSGMFATNLKPDIGADTWWDWYKYPTAQDGTPDVNGQPDLQDDNGQPDYTATDLYKWLNPSAGAFALGAGAVLGTQDDGFTASASISFVLLLPGPVLMLVGKANILSPRIGGPAVEASFEAMAAYDGNADTFDMTVEAQYQVPGIVDVQATAELYVAPRLPLWYLAIGKPPHEQRVSARVLDLWETDFYFVVSDTGIVAGFWTGYKNTWTFGPLSASINAYLAAMAAIQRAPLQVGAGVELHGEVELSAFGIGLGITADALVEATAPDPWWIYGSLSVKLSLPWPLPSPGGTVSLSWGGNGPPPNPPLALSAVVASLADHGTSDTYELLAHRAGAPTAAAPSATTIDYDTQAPGILSPNNPGYWAGKYPGTDLAQDPTVVLPDLDPGTPPSQGTLARAALVPQDSHFTLSFAHPVADLAGFSNPVAPAPDVVTVSAPAALGTDDMSDINLAPPTVQWCIRHSLVQVALYWYSPSNGSSGAGTDPWSLVAATPQTGQGWTNSAPLPLVGTWLATDPATNTPVPATVLKLTPYTVLPGNGYTVPDIYMPIMPETPALYALKIVTRIEAGQPDGNGNVSYQPAADGDPVIEFAYLQTASGPGTATILPAPVAGGFPDPDPDRQPPYPPIAAAAGPAANMFPEGGRLTDLGTYTQWAWPDDGATTAYYGYDVNVEFTETYVNALYGTFLTSAPPYLYPPAPEDPAVHLRCVDRNQRYTLLEPVSLHVPSAPQQSAIDGYARVYPLPQAITNAQQTNATPTQIAVAQRQLASQAPATSDLGAGSAYDAAIKAARLPVTATELRQPALLPPGARQALLTALDELSAAAQVRAEWFAPLAPQTRYTVDVVAGPGPWGRGGDSRQNADSLYPIFAATDPIGVLDALQAFLDAENALTSLQRVQFTTSRYETFTDQVANVVAQATTPPPTSPPPTSPIRHYEVPSGAGAQSWLAGAGATATAAMAASQDRYQAARRKLADIVEGFDPLYDVRQPAAPADPTDGYGEQALAAQRAVTEQAWQGFAAATATAFDGLIAALGQPGLTSASHVPPPPDTELSLLTSDNDTVVQALLLSSPEPLPWRRMWQWTTLQADTWGNPVSGAIFLWSTDQTRALIVPLGTVAGSYTLTFGFQGDIGAETACVTAIGTAVTESVPLPPLQLGPSRLHRR